jgi:predicted acetyltransferase
MPIQASYTWSPPTPDVLEEMNVVLEQALIFPIGSMAAWTADIGHEHMRVVRAGERVIAGLGVIPFGHWFGGRSVRAGGVTAVGVAPDRRGSGVGLWMLQRMLEDQHALGVPLATLYPATTAFYRRAGFERAAQRLIYELPLAALAVREPGIEAVPIAGAELARLPAVYAQRAAQTSGFIDRPEMLWRRLQNPEGKRSYTVAAMRDGAIEGYVTFLHASWGEVLTVRDLVALTPAAGRRLLQVLGDHRSIIENVRLPGAPCDPLLFQLPEQDQRLHNVIDLMVRIVDMPAALTARGYPPDLNAELHLAVVDDLLPWNNGRFVLRIADGVAHVEPGGQGSLQLHIRELAALYSGYFTPYELQLAGNLAADAATLRSAARIFAGPRPWLPDMF